MALKRLAHCHAFRRLERIGLAAAEPESPCARDMSGKRKEPGAVVHQTAEWSPDPIPFDHRKFWRVERSPLAIAKDVRHGKNLRLAGGKQLLHREFRRRVQPGLARRAMWFDERRLKPVQMGLVARGNLEGGGVDFDEAVRVEPPPHETRNARSRQQSAAPFPVAIAAPEWRGGGQAHGTPATPDTIRQSRLAFAAKISI